MEYANIDMIVRRTLLERGLPLHYYLEYLLHATAALRELAKDTLKIVNSVHLKVNDYYAADLPSDYKDEVGVFSPVGGMLKPIAKRSNLNPLRVHNETTGAFEAMSENTNLNSSVLNFLGVNTSVFWFWNVNDWGENTGKYFGSRGGSYQNGYQIFPERRQIQFTGSLAGSDAILMYVSNGQSIDNASQVPWDSFATIQAYEDWKASPNSAFKDSPEARTYYNERRLLRANLNNLTEKDIIEIVRNGFTAAIKN